MKVFELDPRLAADSLPLLDWPLCTLRLMNDARYPWVLLIPRRPGLRELYELNETDRIQCGCESLALSEALMRHFNGHKLNVAALGNVVPQLHIHHIVRFETDDAWPAPVWGRHPALPYALAQLATRVDQLSALLERPSTWA